LSGTTRVSQYQKKHSSTHTYRGHQSIPYLLQPSNMIYGILPIHNLFSTISLLYNLPLTINHISLLVSTGTNCRKFSIHSKFWSPQLHQHLHLHSTCHLNNKTYPLTPDLHWHHHASCTDYWTHATSTNKINVFITLYMLPYIPLHFLCTYFWQLVHCIELLSFINTSITDTSWPSYSRLHYLLPFLTTRVIIISVSTQQSA